jgi:hypothetical protein
VEELLELWSSVLAFDITKEEGLRNFTLQAMLIWTIHDFPRYRTIDGFATCPWCGEDLDAEHSTELGKQTYGGCCQWLSANHILRSDALKAHFNG